MQEYAMCKGGSEEGQRLERQFRALNSIAIKLLREQGPGGKQFAECFQEAARLWKSVFASEKGQGQARIFLGLEDIRDLLLPALYSNNPLVVRGACQGIHASTISRAKTPLDLYNQTYDTPARFINTCQDQTPFAEAAAAVTCFFTCEGRPDMVGSLQRGHANGAAEGLVRICGRKPKDPSWAEAT